MAKRGRPKSASRNEQKKQDADFRKSIEFDESGIHDTAYEQNLSTRAQAHIAKWREQYGNGILIPVAAYIAMGMMREFVAFKGKETLIDRLYQKAQLTGAERQQAGTEGIKRKKLDRAQAVWGKKENKNLVSRIKSGSLTLNSAITIILSDWKARGDNEAKPPSSKTLSNWYFTLYPSK